MIQGNEAIKTYFEKAPEGEKFLSEEVHLNGLKQLRNGIIKELPNVKQEIKKYKKIVKNLTKIGKKLKIKK